MSESLAALLFLAAAAVPVLGVWRWHELEQRKQDVGSALTLSVEPEVVSTAPQHVGEACLRGAGDQSFEETRAPAVRTRRAA